MALRHARGAEEEIKARAQARIEEISALPVYRGRSVPLLTDLYQLTMMYGHFRAGKHRQRVVFDLFYRANPCGNGFVIAAGLEQVVWYLYHLRFGPEEIAYLRSLRQFPEDFLTWLAEFRFTGDLYAVPEGTVVFPNEPILRFEGPLAEVQLVESAVLTFINHQSLIATKARRIVEAARSDPRHPDAPVLEMGLRRAQNMDAAVFGARAAYIAGCAGTSNLLAGQSFGIPVVGTQGHSWIQSFPSEIDAFRAYADAFPDATTLLVDTYDVLRSGIPNAITVAKELEARGYRLRAVRIDSGDLAYLSKRARAMLDAAGLSYVGIIASSDLDERTIRDLILQGAEINAWGVGTHLITSYDCPALGGVFKLAAKEEDGVLQPCIKVSENAAKVTNPGKKKVLRLYVDGQASADLIALDDEPDLNPAEPLELFDPVHTYKRKVIQDYQVEPLLVPVFLGGQLVYELPDIAAIRRRVEESLAKFSSEVRRPINPHIYHVDLSLPLWELKQRLLHQMRPVRPQT
ncbi:nicotinate phosphoribosyltransferase [Alicyclobacillus cellulosilyticus]|uniref:Nicotinate phosphoribosyltransferase n=1 Tax=Alicyclobacillus cellulosilyticus TaxID=1003997 RepID=A0A917K2Z0_9BACL|nr:nicotinate phosphoribosyltransferase [Alicyclobacillus cellulosilyticus]GGI98855.1 nicotinate phosphoribosyltransferase [Alicyclobacillus cellulosilyticus]